MSKINSKIKQWMNGKTSASKYSIALFGTLALIISLVLLTSHQAGNFLSASQATDSSSSSDVPTDEATPTDTPTDTPEEITSPTPDAIDCTGPDGKQLQITQQQCDDFNISWKALKYGSTSTNSYNSQLVSCQFDNTTATLPRFECTNLQNYYGKNSASSLNSDSSNIVIESTPIPFPTLPQYPGGESQCEQDKYADLANLLVQSPLGDLPTPTYSEYPVLLPSTVGQLMIEAKNWCFDHFAN